MVSLLVEWWYKAFASLSGSLLLALLQFTLCVKHRQPPFAVIHDSLHSTGYGVQQDQRTADMSVPDNMSEWHVAVLSVLLCEVADKSHAVLRKDAR